MRQRRLPARWTAAGEQIDESRGRLCVIDNQAHQRGLEMATDRRVSVLRRSLLGNAVYMQDNEQHVL